MNIGRPIRHVWDPKIGSTTVCGRFCMEFNMDAVGYKTYVKTPLAKRWFYCIVCTNTLRNRKRKAFGKKS